MANSVNDTFFYKARLTLHRGDWRILGMSSTLCNFRSDRNSSSMTPTYPLENPFAGSSFLVKTSSSPASASDAISSCFRTPVGQYAGFQLMASRLLGIFATDCKAIGCEELLHAEDELERTVCLPVTHLF